MGRKDRGLLWSEVFGIISGKGREQIICGVYGRKEESRELVGAERVGPIQDPAFRAPFWILGPFSSPFSNSDLIPPP